MEYIEAPVYLEEYPSPAIFLGGGITGCPDWQKTMTELLKNEQGILFNPRRLNFDIKKPDVSREQIKWEFDHLWKSDIVMFWFCKETIQPIVLLELGARLAHAYLTGDSTEGISFNQALPKSPEIIIGIEPGYPREEDVLIQSELALGVAPKISRTLEDLAVRVKAAIHL